MRVAANLMTTAADAWAAGLVQPGTRPAADVTPDTLWGSRLENVTPEAAVLGHSLRERGVLASADDQIGYELGDEGWQAELAWEVRRVAVLADGPEDEVADCVAAYAAAGWDARLARNWPSDELAGRILGGDR